MRTDPTDNGGLFIGRRPGTAPIRYRGTVFAVAVAAVVGVTLFVLWFLFLAGPGPEAAGGRR